MMTSRCKLLDNKSVGTFKPTEWIKEGDGLLASARVTRALWYRRKRSLKKNLDRCKNSKRTPWHEVEGLPRASMLLLGYSVEMFLKAGLVKLYKGCREEMFDRDVRKEFSHNLEKIAKEISFPFLKSDKKNLTFLEDMIKFDARYPVKVDDRAEYIPAANTRARKTSNRDKFNCLLDLAERARNHVKLINGDSKNCASHWKLRVDIDGYITFRHGGHLPPRITYRISSIQKKQTHNYNSLKDIFDFLADVPGFSVVAYYDWSGAKIYEDCKNKTEQKKFPSA